MAQWGWTTSGYQVKWHREVVAVNNNELTLDAPIVHPIEAVYGGAHGTDQLEVSSLSFSSFGLTCCCSLLYHSVEVQLCRGD